MTVGWFAPPPGSRTGVADYAAALLPALELRVSVTPNGSDADVCLYHLGNNHLHRRIYAQALARPGVVVLHDAVLHHFFLGSLDERAYAEEFVFNYGEWHRELAVVLWRDRARSAVDPRFFRYPMLKRIAERSLAIVVHNAGAAAMVRRHAPDARIYEIPHLFASGAAPEYEVVRLRKRWPFPPDAFVFGVFGHLRESKRLLPVLRVFERVHRALPNCGLLVAGDFASSDLARAAAPLLARSGILRVPYAPERDFARMAAAVDACINLRYPPAGETSGITIRLMGAGKPVILTAGEETSGFPQDACLRIEAGPCEEDMLFAAMSWLAQSPQTAREIGRRASLYIRREHAPDVVAARYADALAHARAAPLPLRV